MRFIACMAFSVWLWAAGAASAQVSMSDSLSELNRRLDILAEEIERIKLGSEVASADESLFGLGPAASKIYRTERGVSIGGYGEMVYTNFAKKRQDGVVSGKTDQLDFLRAIVYVGYKFNQRWLLNTEFEFEHASTGSGGEVSAEFVHLEYLFRPELNLRFGLLLVPMGLVNELHEPTVFMAVDRPDIERVIIPSTWRENGAGLFGDIGMISYRTYVVNGLKASGFSSGGIRSGRQKGAVAKANHFAWTGRLDVTPHSGLMFGGSAYAGYSGQDEKILKTSLVLPKASTVIVEGHADIRYQGLWLSALAARASIGDAALVNQALDFTGNKSVGETLQGFYIQAGYDIFSRTSYTAQSLMPYFRYEQYDTQSAVPTGFSRDTSKEIRNATFGVAYYPESRIVFKADFRVVRNEARTGVNQINAGVGYIF